MIVKLVPRLGTTAVAVACLVALVSAPAVGVQKSTEASFYNGNLNRHVLGVIERIIEEQVSSFPMFTSTEAAQHELSLRSRYVSGAIAAMKQADLLHEGGANEVLKTWTARSSQKLFENVGAGSLINGVGQNSEEVSDLQPVPGVGLEEEEACTEERKETQS